MKSPRIFSTAALTVLLAAAGTNAEAGPRVFHASTCQAAKALIASNPETAANLNPVVYNSFGQTGNTNSTASILYCPIAYDSASGVPTSGSIAVDLFYNGGSSTSAQMCATFAGGGGAGFSCGGVTPPSAGGGVKHISLTSMPTGAVVGDYYFLKVSLGPQNAGSFNTFFGYQ